MTAESDALASACTRLVNDVLTIALVHGRVDQACDVADTVFVGGSLAGAVFLAGLAFAVTDQIRLPMQIPPGHGLADTSPQMAAARLVTMASRQDHDMLHAVAVVAAQQPRPWRDRLLTSLFGAVVDARIFRALIG